MSTLSHLNPAPVWTYFEEICKIPRLSKNEGKIRQYLLDFALRHNLESKEDKAGNILITKPASPGYENRKTLVLQSHMDMVGEKNSSYLHNWATDPIVPIVDNGWVTAKVTTLGADDGIGIASQLAILSDINFKAGRIECLFTVDEETGLTGAYGLESDFFEGRILLNLDSEDEGILFIGCAGGIDTILSFKYLRTPVTGNTAALEISVTGLHGGHSGDEIHRGYANSIKLMTRLLRDLSDRYEISLNRLNGGNLRNAIPREAFSIILVNRSVKEEIIKRINKFQEDLEIEFGDLEKDLKVNVTETNIPSFVMEQEDQSKLLNSLECCPHGVIAWSKDMEGLVETSTNLAIITFTEDNIVTVITTQRSSVESSKIQAAKMVESCFKNVMAEVSHSTGYPGWKPDLNSEVLRITVDAYKRLFGRVPDVKAIHAGLECGLFYEKYKGIDMISFGPTIKGAHTPDEKIVIETVQMFWDLLVEVIRNIPLKAD